MAFLQIKLFLFKFDTNKLRYVKLYDLNVFDSKETLALSHQAETQKKKTAGSAVRRPKVFKSIREKVARRKRHVVRDSGP